MSIIKLNGEVTLPCITLLHSEWPKLHRVLAVLSAIGLNFGKPKTINFPFGTNGKLLLLVVPIHKQ